MNYFAVDIGGSSIKYAVMIEEMQRILQENDLGDAQP